MLSINLAPIFIARVISSPHSFLVKNGFSNVTASNLLNNQTRVFRLDHVERLCTLLVCDPNDLLLFTPDKDKQYDPDSPLLKLRQDEALAGLPSALATMPFKQLKEQLKSSLGK